MTYLAESITRFKSLSLFLLLSIFCLFPPVAHASNPSYYEASFTHQSPTLAQHGVSTAITGGSFGDNFVANLRIGAVSVLGAEIAGEIGAARRNGGDRLTQLISHAALGCAMGAGLQSGGCASGAIGGFVGEMVAEAYLADQLGQGLTIADIDQLQVTGVNLARLGAGIAAMAAGEDVNIAANTGGNAAENNALDAIWDTLSILYDTGKIAYGYFTDDKGLVKEGFIDLSADGVALLVPGLLAGSTKITRISANGAKKLDDALDAKTAIKTVDAGDAAKVANSTTISFESGQLQAKFKHAADFGISGNWNKDAASAFENALKSHLDSPTTQMIQGSYRGESVTHFFDPQTGLNVIKNTLGNFVSGWKLSPKQIRDVTATGKLGGG